MSEDSKVGGLVRGVGRGLRGTGQYLPSHSKETIYQSNETQGKKVSYVVPNINK